MRHSIRCAVLALLASSSVFYAAYAAHAKTHKGAEVYTQKAYRHGKIRFRMLTARGSGILSTFFLYKDGSEKTGELWEEVDVEVFGKGDGKTWQSNIITGAPRKTSEEVHSHNFSFADAYHTFDVEWTPQAIAWSVDGKEVRRTQGGQVAELANPQSVRFNLWASTAEDWVGAFDDAVLPQYQFVSWIEYYRYEKGAFVLDWRDDFNTFDTARWGKANWTFDGNRVDFEPENASVKDGTLVLALTREGQTGFTGAVPVDTEGSSPGQQDAGQAGGPIDLDDGGSNAAAGSGGTGTNPAESQDETGTDTDGCGCKLGRSGGAGAAAWLALLGMLGLGSAYRRRQRRMNERTQ